MSKKTEVKSRKMVDPAVKPRDDIIIAKLSSLYQSTKAYIIKDFLKIVKIIVALKLLIIASTCAYLYYIHSTKNFNLLLGKTDSLIGTSNQILMLAEQLAEKPSPASTNVSAAPPAISPTPSNNEATSSDQVNSLKYQAWHYLSKIQQRIDENKPYDQLITRLEAAFHGLVASSALIESGDLASSLAILRQYSSEDLSRANALSACSTPAQSIKYHDTNAALSWAQINDKLLHIIEITPLSNVTARKAQEKAQDSIVTALTYGDFKRAATALKELNATHDCKTMLDARIQVDQALDSLLHMVNTDD